jgi:AAA ATPase domain
VPGEARGRAYRSDLTGERATRQAVANGESGSPERQVPRETDCGRIGSAERAAIRASSVESRFEAMHSTGLTALVGREEELELLVRRWSRAKTGEGQVVLLSGEAGIGKSRLTAALLEHLATEPHTPLRYFCTPQHTDSALYPIISQMERAARLAHDDTAQANLDKLDAVLAQCFTPPRDAALFAEMLPEAQTTVSAQRRESSRDRNESSSCGCKALNCISGSPRSDQL